MLSYFNIKTISNLNEAIIKYGDKIVQFGKIWLGEKQTPPVNLGAQVSIFFLGYVLAILKINGRSVEDYSDNFFSNPEVKKDLTDKLNEVGKKIS